MSPSKTVSPGRLLTQAAGERATGALVVEGQPGGTVYLVEGAVIYAESPAAAASWSSLGAAPVVATGNPVV